MLKFFALMLLLSANLAGPVAGAQEAGPRSWERLFEACGADCDELFDRHAPEDAEARAGLARAGGAHARRGRGRRRFRVAAELQARWNS
jgi:hypothetical protein